MKAIYILLLLSCLLACTDSGPKDDRSTNDRATLDSDDEMSASELAEIANENAEPAEASKSLGSELESSDEVPSALEQHADSEVNAMLEESLMQSLRQLSKNQDESLEQSSVDQLEQLSESDRQSLQENTAVETAQAADAQTEYLVERVEKEKKAQSGIDTDAIFDSIEESDVAESEENN